MFNTLIDRYQIQEVIPDQIGKSGDEIYLLKNKHQNFYLKISRNKEILSEIKAYSFLKNKVIVPQVFENILGYDGRYYLLMSEIKGKMLHELLKEDIDQTIRIYASSLKQLHHLPYENFPNKPDLHRIVEDIEPRLNKIDINDLEPITKERGLQKTYERLKELFPKERDLVICHGDFCMPNIIVNQDNVGFIDLGRSRIDDRYADIALALRSLKSNMEMIGQSYLPQHQELFLKTYGINQFDHDKCEFYYLLDEFF